LRPSRLFTFLTQTRIQVRSVAEVMPLNGVSTSSTGTSSPACSEPTAVRKTSASAIASARAVSAVPPAANAR
jgi:hypothetical protein